MKNKPEHKKRKFVPQTISKTLAGVNKKFLYKFGKLDYIIFSKWSEIVGNFFNDYSEPLKISSVKISINEYGEKTYDNYLHVSVTPAAALEFQHFQDKIIEKINSYFGYKAIKGIKIHQQYIKKDITNNNFKEKNLIKMKENSKQVKQSIPKISNKDLEESIVKLGISITNEKE